MTAFLYISYSRGLSEEDRLIIDKSVFENREVVRRFVIPSNVKDKTIKLIIVIYLATLVCFSGLESADAIGLPMPTAPVVRVQPNFEDSLKKPEIFVTNRVRFTRY